MRGRTVLRRVLARHRRSPLVERLHRVAVFIDEACSNVGLEIADDGELDLLRRLAPLEFQTVIDAGAHVGEWSMHVLERWPSTTVHAFEVAPETFRRLQAAVSEAKMSARVVLNKCGLGDRSGHERMFYYPDHPELTCDFPRHACYTKVAFEAPMITGDEYVARQDLGRIDFLKIDVEGAEHRVLNGFAETLAQTAIRCIQFEYGAFSIDTKVLLRDYYEILQARYVIGKIFPTYVDFRDYDWTDEDFRFSNFLCVSREDPQAVLLARDLTG